MPSEVIVCDVLILGSGLAGCRAAIEAASCGLKVNVVSKTHPLRSHSGAAQGGINISINEENPLSHIEDTLIGAAGLANPVAVDIMCNKAKSTLAWLQKHGAVFNMHLDGKIAQRAFGGQSVNRTCYSEDRTGMTLLQTVYEQAQRAGAIFFPDHLAIDLLHDDEGFFGAVCTKLSTGENRIFLASSVLLASGGCCRSWEINTNAHSNSGDIQALVLRHGLPLTDMEFIQFHPTGLYPSGILISEAARSLGGRFLTTDGAPLLEIYNTTNQTAVHEMSTRDKLSMILALEIRKQKNNQNYILLDLSHLEEKSIRDSLPELCELAKVYANKDLAKEPVPVSPAAHYAMGGILTDIHGCVLDWEGHIVKGLYAAGECACVGVHGANRLGGNSLLEALVFGEITGQTISNEKSHITSSRYQKIISKKYSEPPMESRPSRNKDSNHDWILIRKTLRKIMTAHCGVLRTKSELEENLIQLQILKNNFALSSPDDSGHGFSSVHQEFFELGCMIDVSLAVTHSALSRKESRGSHQRLDYPESDQEAVHSFYRMEPSLEIKTIPVRDKP